MCVSGPGLEAVAAKDHTVWEHAHLISVYARMKPEQKVRAA